MRVFALVLVAPLCCCGCGTVANYVTGNPPKTYGGVAFDLDQAAKLVDGETGPMNAGLGSSDSGAGAAIAAAMAVGLAVWPVLDLPLSLIGDTVTYPLTKWIENPVGP